MSRQTEQDGKGLHHATLNGAKFKTYDSFLSGIFYLIFLDCGWPSVTETSERKTASNRDYWVGTPVPLALLGNSRVPSIPETGILKGPLPCAALPGHSALGSPRRPAFVVWVSCYVCLTA